MVRALTLLHMEVCVQTVYGLHSVLIKHEGVNNRVHSLSRCIINNACKHVREVSSHLCQL